MLAMTSKMRNAFNMGSKDDVRAATSFFSIRSRPKSRMMRKARMRRMVLTGSSTGPRATSDMRTTTASTIHHPFEMNGYSQYEYKLMASSMVNMVVKKKSI